MAFACLQASLLRSAESTRPSLGLHSSSAGQAAAAYWKQALHQARVPNEIVRLLPTMPASAADTAAARLTGATAQPMSEAATARLCAATEMACTDDGRYVGNVAIGSQVWYYGPGSALGYYGIVSVHTAAAHAAGGQQQHLFFRERDLHDPKFQFRTVDAIENWSLQRAFLPRAVAAALQADSADRALRLLRVPAASRVAGATRGTAHFCGELQLAAAAADQNPQQQSPSKKWWQGVARCVASVEDLADFVASELGGGTAAVVDALPGTDMDAVRGLDEATLQAVAGGDFRVLGAPHLKKAAHGSFVACHVMPAAFQTMLCHTQPRTKLYWVTLQSTAAPDARVGELAVCHMDTSDWNPDHRSFAMLGTRPGEAEACHWANLGLLALFLQQEAADTGVVGVQVDESSSGDMTLVLQQRRR